jgi:hypothetical protein
VRAAVEAETEDGARDVHAGTRGRYHVREIRGVRGYSSAISEVGWRSDRACARGAGSRRRSDGLRDRKRKEAPPPLAAAAARSEDIPPLGEPGGRGQTAVEAFRIVAGARRTPPPSTRRTHSKRWLGERPRPDTWMLSVVGDSSAGRTDTRVGMK